MYHATAYGEDFYADDFDALVQKIDRFGEEHNLRAVSVVADWIAAPVHGILFVVKAGDATVAMHEVYPNRQNFKFGYEMARRIATHLEGWVEFSRSPETNYELLAPE